MSALVLPAALAIVVGLTMGMLGGGGSILMVPILRYVSGLEARQAIATSLVVVGATSAGALIQHARAGRVRYRTGLLFGAGGMAGAFLGGRAAGLVSGNTLLVLFALVMLAAGLAMLRGRRETSTGQAPAEAPVLRVLLQGAVVGSLTGLVGAGGGFLVVPALVLLGGLPMEAAVGTSLLVITMQTISALAGQLGHAEIAWEIALSFSVLAVLGSWFGERLGKKTQPATLRKAFGGLVIVTAVVMLTRELLLAETRGEPGWWAQVAMASLVLAGILGRKIWQRPANPLPRT